MNTTQAREISIEKVLQNLGCEPTKSNEKESWYLSPFRVEKSASFKVNKKMNRWFDHGEQKGGNVIDFIIFKFGFSITEALHYLEKFNDFFYFQKQVFEISDKKEESYNIEKVIPIQHLALIQYLKGRGITKYQKENNLKEIHYTINERKFFALGFKNNAGGFEVRSKYVKICLGVKDVTLIKNDSDTLRIFEGFFDYLSFIQKQELNEKSDYLILNSIALLNKNSAILENYDAIELYLDNDTTGDKYTLMVTEKFKNTKDCRAQFVGFKDLNEYLTNNTI